MTRPPTRNVQAHTTDPRPILLFLISVNVAVFVAWHTLRNESGPSVHMLNHFLVSLAAVDGERGFRYWTLLTSAFSHMDAAHLVFNLLSLWVFGRDVAAVLGAWRFLQLYVVGGILASFGHVLFQGLTGAAEPALGASGSIMAIAVVFAAMFPQRRLLLQFLIPVPAALAVALYVLLDLVGAVSGSGTNIAHAAHLGGAAYGLFYWLVYVRQSYRS